MLIIKPFNYSVSPRTAQSGVPLPGQRKRNNTLCEMSRRMFIAFHDDRVSSKHVMMFARIASSALTIATRTLVTRLLLNPLAISGRAPQPMLSR